MFETIKKTVQASIGAAVLTRERIRKTLDKLVQEGKLSTEEAERLADRMIRDSKTELKSIQDRMVSLIQRGLGNLDFVSKKDFKVLEKRVKALEKEMKGKRAAKAKRTKGTGRS
ncbi:MAG: hypothetical protein GTN74_02220 [Proteobacteria bacterium]|nr:hypothetical protein [Pseudomonadota bacterium]NIS67968.1 hypothetical protein [Pseudomonadota bacterium]